MFGATASCKTATLSPVPLLIVRLSTFIETSLGLEPIWFRRPRITVQSEALVDLNKKHSVESNHCDFSSYVFVCGVLGALPGKAAGRAHDKTFSNQRSSTNVTAVKLQAGHPWPNTGRGEGAVSSYTGVQFGASTHYSYSNKEKENEWQILYVKYWKIYLVKYLL